MYLIDANTSNKRLSAEKDASIVSLPTIKEK